MVALSRQRQVDLYAFMARLVSIVSFRTASAMYRNPASSKQTIKLACIRYEHQTNNICVVNHPISQVARRIREAQRLLSTALTRC